MVWKAFDKSIKTASVAFPLSASFLHDEISEVSSS